MILAVVGAVVLGVVVIASNQRIDDVETPFLANASFQR